jgi:hypothetical protein
MKQKMLLSLTAPLVMMGLLNAQSPLRPAAAQKLEGLWSCTYITDVAPGVLPPVTNYGLSTYSPDGLVTSMVTSITPPIPAVQNLGNQISAGVGVWVRIGDGQFRATQMQLIFKNGVPGGVQRTRVTLTLNDTLDGATGTGTAEFLDLSGNVVFSGVPGAAPAAVSCSRVGVDASPAPPASY